MVWVRGPSSSTGSILVRGSRASHRKTHLCGAAQPGAQQWSTCTCASWRLQIKRSCKSCACTPARVRKAGDGGLSGAEDPCGRRGIQPFGKPREHHGDLLGGGFQPVQRRVASSTEGSAARLTAKRLDRLSTTVLAIAKKPRGTEHRCCRSTRTAGWDKRSPRC